MFTKHYILLHNTVLHILGNSKATLGITLLPQAFHNLLKNIFIFFYTKQYLHVINFHQNNFHISSYI